MQSGVGSQHARALLLAPPALSKNPYAILFQAMSEREDAVRARPLPERGTASSASSSVSEPFRLTTRDPDSSEVQRAAAAALTLAEPVSCAVLQGVQPTVGLVTTLVAAAEAAIEKTASSSQPEQVQKMNLNQKVGRVCAVLTGVVGELQQPGALELLGKRAKKVVVDSSKKLKLLQLQLKSDLHHAKSVKGGAAAVAAKHAACKELHAAACEELRSKSTGCLAVSSSPAPAAAQAGASSSRHPLVPTMTRSDSEAAATLLHASGRAWSCSKCAMLHEEALEARRAADAAADAKRLAEEAQARMWASKEEARRMAEEQLSALEAEHAAALEMAQERFGVALLKERNLRKEAQKEAETRRRDLILEEARRAQVCRGTWETVQARDSTGASLAKAEAEMQRVLERESAGQARQMQREQELRGRLQALEDERQRLQQEHKLDRKALRDAHLAAMKEAQATARQQKEQLVLAHREAAAAAALELRQAQHQTRAAQTRLGCIEAEATAAERALHGWVFSVTALV